MRIAAILLLLAGLVGCARSTDDYTEDLDGLCVGINDRFANEMPFNGKNFGTSDLPTLDKRVEQIRNLRAEAAATPLPEEATRPDDWLFNLDKLTEEMTTLATAYKNAKPGSDLVLAMTINIVDTVADDTGISASRNGLTTCADTTSWRIFPKKAPQ
ncbi:MAG: hypothetical protein ABW215_02060 [Kibdelosporangium sp.]